MSTKEGNDMNKIYEKSIGFRLMKKVVIALFSIFYRRITLFGTENIPSNEGPVIFAPVHQNALMDALSVHCIFSGPIVFMMRGDAFSNHAMSRLLRYMKIMPIFRHKDGRPQLIQDKECINTAAEGLTMGRCIALMPEGNQKEQKRLRTLGKGIFRIGFQAQKELGEKAEVTIIPIGLDFENYDRTGSRLIIQIGRPLYFSPLGKLYEQNQAAAFCKMKEQLTIALHRLIIDIRNERSYKSYYLATLLATEEMIKKKKIKGTDEVRFAFRKMIAERFPETDDADVPVDLRPFVEQANKLLKLESDPDKAFVMNKGLSIFELTRGVAYLPFIIPSILFNGLPYFLIRRWAFRKFKNNGFIASATFIGGTILFPLYWTILFVIFSTISDPMRSAFFFLLLSPLLAILSIRVLHLYEDIFLKMKFRLSNARSGRASHL